MIGRTYLWVKRLYGKFSGHPLFYPILFIVLSAYWLVFAQLYKFRGLRSVGWHTHILLPISLYGIIYVLFKYVIAPIFNLKSKRFIDNWAYGVWVYLVIEIFIFVTGYVKVNNEDVIGQYNAHYEDKGASYYHTWKPGSRHWLSNNEFHYERMSNSLGFADKEWDAVKPEGAFRILCLGDSFTEGDGAHADSTYPAFLEKILKKYGQVEVLNAGTCGSDPYFSFINYKDRLYKYQPDLIIQTISANDLAHDIPIRGGLERFTANERLVFTKPPWWEPLYAVSYIFRIFINVSGYNPDLTRNSEIYKNLENYIAEIRELFISRYSTLTRKQGTQLVVVYLPMKGELENVTEDIIRKKMKRFESDAEYVYKDLYSYYHHHISSVKGITVSDYYWKFDAHHNAKGYELMAKSIYDAIQIVLPDSLRSASF